MFGEIARFEIRSQLGRPMPYVFFLALFLMSFLIIANDVTGDGLSSGRVYRNAPHLLSGFIAFSSILGIVAIAAIVGKAVHRDVEHGTRAFLFALPFSKIAFLGGRFVGALVVVFGVFTGVGLGCFFGALLPGLDPATVAPFDPLVYVAIYGLYLLPNLFVMSCVFFALVAWTRRIAAAYTGAVLLFAVYIISVIMSANLDAEGLVALLDPFGERAIDFATRHWTVAELNSRFVPLTGQIVLNRAVWGALGLSVLGLTFVFLDQRKTIGRPGRRVQTLSASDEATVVIDRALPQARKDFSWRTHGRQTLSMARLAFKNTITDRVFVSIFLAAVIVLFLDAWIEGRPFGVSIYPVTYEMLAIKDGIYLFLVYAILVFFAGELIWQDRKARMSLVTDAFPVPSWSLYGSKLLALAMICVLMTLAVLVVGLVVQTLKGYFDYELALYLKELLLITLPNYLLVAAMCLVVHILLNNRFVGTFLGVVLWIAVLNLDKVGYGHPLYRYSVLPTYIYSDMNGYGHFVAGIAWFTLYWAWGGACLLLVGSLFWARGVETSFTERVRSAVKQLRGRTGAVLALMAGAFLVTGSYIYYNTEILNRRSEAIAEVTDAQRVEYELRYKVYEQLAQPRITAVRIEADLYPEALGAAIRGTYTLQNKSGEQIDSLYAHISKYDIEAITLNGETVEPVLADPAHRLHVYALEPALAPGSSVTFGFHLRYQREGFSASRENTDIVRNGTFFTNADLPSFGYDRTHELADNQARERHGLPHRPRFAPLETERARRNSIVSRDADWIEFEAVVSTPDDQIAVAPGRLERSWTDGARRHFHYKSTSPIHNFYPILSARYAIHRDSWGDVDIEIYYHKKHTYNLDRMVRAVQRSLAYYTTNFGPYNHDHIRIVEFPRYMTNAQAYSGTIPYSEAIGFIAQVKEGDIDMPTYVIAHEVAHQWWGHQVVSADVQGAALLSESMSQYGALMVMEEEYGPAYMQGFLKFELGRYLTGRSAETDKELPLSQVEFQNYVHYAKGSLAMYALKDYVGERALNEAIRGYVETVALQEAPYTTSADFLSHLKKALPGSLESVIVDLFERITLYENRVTEASYRRLADGSYEVTLRLDVRKLYADGLGVEEETPMADWIDVGIFGARDAEGESKRGPVYLRKHQLSSGENLLTIRVDTLPLRAGVDPYNKLIDRNSGDNMADVLADNGSFADGSAPLKRSL